MQTSRERLELAGTQVPLLREDQIQPGVLLTGVAMSHIWEVLRIERTQVFIRKLPATTTPCVSDAHTFAAYGRGHVCSVCQTRKQAISEFMPKREEKARVHVIQPRNALIAPQPYTIYGYRLPDGSVKTISLMTDNTWSEALPVVPALSVVWTIPESLRRMVRDAPQTTPVDPDF